MIARLKNIEFKYFPILLIILYVPFHVLEEALNNFPLWMSEHYNFPKPLSYPHWLINNAVFLSVLLIGLFIFMKDRIRFLPFGIGIVFWAFMNSMEHIIFSIVDFKVSPGIVTAMLFFLTSLFGFIKLKVDNFLNPKLILKSFLIGLCYWIVSFSIIILIGNYLIKIFPMTTE